MSGHDHFLLLARYNAWMNDKLYAAAGTLAPEALLAERGAYFGSILGTLNHIVAGDTIWLRRFASHPARFPALQLVLDMPAPASLATMYSRDLGALALQRRVLDEVISDFVAQIGAADLDQDLQYANMKGVTSARRFGSLLLHFFNHQTHHRGQASTLLTQAGVDIGVTDLLMLIPEETGIG